MSFLARTRTRLAVAVALIAAVAAVAGGIAVSGVLSGDQEIDPTKAHVTDAVLARGLSETFVAQQPGFTFPADIQTIYALVVLDNVFDPTNVTGVWSYLGPSGNASAARVADAGVDVLPIAAKARSVGLQVSKPLFDLGIYRLDVLVNNQKQRTLEFTIVAASGATSAPPVSPTTTAPVAPTTVAPAAVPTAVPAQPTAEPEPTQAPPPPAPTEAPPPPPPPENQTYVVRSGDTLAALAASWGVSVQEIIDTNGIANPNVLIPGFALQVPPGGTLPP